MYVCMYESMYVYMYIHACIYFINRYVVIGHMVTRKKEQMNTYFK